MPLRLDIKRKLTARSDRVKCVDQHPTEPWLLCSLYNGDVNIWNYETQLQIKRFEVCDLPVRAAKFVPRKNWVITGSDDMQIRVFNYNTLERVHNFEAHSDYVRCIAVHPTQPYILTSSDDLLIKLWNWDRNWSCQQVFEGHTHYVMQIVINPKDNNTFASASLDKTVKVWQLGSSIPNFTLEGHEKGVNCVDYYHGGDKPYLISGADDRLVKIWDYQNKTCVQTLEGHAQNVSAVSFHPELPILLTGSEDGTVRIWHAGTYRLESSLNYGFERVWTISSTHGSNNVAVGYDEGTIMIKVGREEPAISMDVNGGKIIWAKHSEMQQVNLKALPEGTDIKDGERLPLVVKDMGSCEIYPQTIAHNPNGRFVVVCGDGEYIIYTAMALRNKAFGTAQEFVWAFDSSEYATLENSSTIKVFKNFKERKSFKPEYGAEGIFGGFMLGVKSISGMAFSIYDWEHLELIRRIEIQPRHVFWSESGSLVCLATDEAYFILRYNAAVVTLARETNSNITEDGIEDAFEDKNWRVLETLPLLRARYWPTPWCVEARLQTVLGSLLRSVLLPRVAYSRQLLRLADGGTVALDWVQDAGGPTRPVLLVLPGLTGGSEADYARCLALAARDLGAHCVVFNQRGLGGLPLTSPRLYCAVSRADLAEVVAAVAERAGAAPLLAVGMSLGGLILGQYLAEYGDKAAFAAAFIVSSPLDVVKGGDS